MRVLERDSRLFAISKSVRPLAVMLEMGRRRCRRTAERKEKREGSGLEGVKAVKRRSRHGRTVAKKRLRAEGDEVVWLWREGLSAGAGGLGESELAEKAAVEGGSSQKARGPGGVREGGVCVGVPRCFWAVTAQLGRDWPKRFRGP